MIAQLQQDNRNIKRKALQEISKPSKEETSKRALVPIVEDKGKQVADIDV